MSAHSLGINILRASTRQSAGCGLFSLVSNNLFDVSKGCVKSSANAPAKYIRFKRTIAI
jgi:hypothetical protein